MVSLVVKQHLGKARPSREEQPLSLHQEAAPALLASDRITVLLSEYRE
jgi:hypothetical protein